MTFDQLKTQYLGQPIDIDSWPKNNPYQCTDWATLAANTLAGIHAGLFVPKNGNISEGGAADAFYNFGDSNNFISPQNGDLITNNPNDPSQVPQQGDFIIFDRNTGNGMAGHIAIFDRMGDDSNHFYSLDQNAPEPKVCEVLHTFIEGLGFSKVIGWIRLKNYQGQVPVALDSLVQMLLCIRQNCFIYARDRQYDMFLECPEVIASAEALHFDIAMQKQVDIIMAQKALILALQAQVANLTHKNS